MGVIVIEFAMRLYVSSQFASELYFSIRNQVELLIAIISFIGMYGFIYKKRILSHIFWMIFFVLLVLYDCWDIYLDAQFNNKLDQMYPTEPDVSEAAMDFFFTYILSLPCFIALFVYGFKSKAIWKKQALNKKTIVN